jgi:UDP-glucuronate 4-epimerase
MTVLVTGAAGFIGYHVARDLLARGEDVAALDNFSPYYDVRLKQARLARLEAHRGFRFRRLDLKDRADVEAAFRDFAPDRIVHLAAQPGVRYSLEAPHTYADANLTGFLNVIEGARQLRLKHLVFASTSSVYGANTAMPFSTHGGADHPLSLYAATKKANEAMAHAYAHLFGIPMTGLRFFTVYGPWGRPDMAMFRFTRAILDGEPLEVFGNGRMSRDFTFVDDIASGVLAALDRPAAIDPSWDSASPDPATSGVAPYRIFNIGNAVPVDLMRYIRVIEDVTGRKANLKMLPMQPGDVSETWADVSDLARETGYRPSTPVEAGVRRFVDWYTTDYRELLGAGA